MKNLILFLLSVACCQFAAAATLEFSVVARDGKPVPWVVITAGDKTVETNSGTAIMDQIHKAFAPYVLAVHAGQNVSFPNSDHIRHHVYSFSDPKPFELKLYSGEPEAPINFPNEGVVVLGCNIHDNMVGYIYVTQRPLMATTDIDGRAALSSNAPVTEIEVWHPALSLDSLTRLSFPIDQLNQQNGVYQIRLDIDQPDPDPQAIRMKDREQFKRFLNR
ncbi:MAG: methylamine utilization protein [Pseudomonadales bacterium]|nr:methylamine utilization protein [Pseudomonadales bacterium]